MDNEELDNEELDNEELDDEEPENEKKNKKLNRRQFMGLIGSTTVGAALGVAASQYVASNLKALERRVAILESKILDNSFKAALMILANKVAYVDPGGPEYCRNLYYSMYKNRSLQYISASLALNGHVVNEDDTLDTLKPFLTVIAHYTDGTKNLVSDYELFGTLIPGVSTITVFYQEKYSSFSVKVARLIEDKYIQLSYIATDGDQYIDTGLSAVEPARARYEIAYTAMSANGGHILSSDLTYFPFFKGDGSNKTINAKNWGNEDVSTGTKSFEWEYERLYEIEAFPEIKIDRKQIATMNRTHRPGTANFYLFTYGGEPTYIRYRFIGKLYSAKIYDENGELLRNFIPCMDEFGVAGLYDMVTHAFYSSATKSPLIAGEVL